MNFNDIEEYSDYYASQLILQYISKPKAHSTVKSIAECLFVNFRNMGIWRDLESADGDALLSLAELFGISGYFDGIGFYLKYFATEGYSQNGALTSIQEGFQKYDSAKDGLFLQYADSYRRALVVNVSSAQLRGIIRMKSLSIISDFTSKNIQIVLDNYFPGCFISETYAPPTIIYNFPRKYNVIFRLLEQKKYLLKPPGVSYSVNMMEDS